MADIDNNIKEFMDRKKWIDSNLDPNMAIDIVNEHFNQIAIKLKLKENLGLDTRIITIIYTSTASLERRIKNGGLNEKSMNIIIGKLENHPILSASPAARNALTDGHTCICIATYLPTSHVYNTCKHDMTLNHSVTVFNLKI